MGKLSFSKVVRSPHGLNTSPIAKIMAMADEKNIKTLGLNPKEVISFAGGWVNHPAPEGLRRAYRDIASRAETFHESGGYSATNGSFEIRRVLAAWEAQIMGARDITDKHVIVGQSSSQLMFSVLTALLDPGDTVLFFDPTYAHYFEQAFLAQRGRRIRSIRAFDERLWRYRDEDEILNDFVGALRYRPKLLVFASPENPTGHMFSDGFVREVLTRAGRHGCVVAIDFAYSTFYYTTARPDHFSLSPAEFPNLVKVYSNSKWSRSLGRRFGWVIADTEVVQALKVVQQALILCPDTLHQAALISYLKSNLKNGGVRTYLERVRKEYQRVAEFTMKCVERFLGVRYVAPLGGLYVTIEMTGGAERFVQRALRETAVLAVSGTHFGKSLQKGVRISFGPLVNDTQKIEEGFKRMRRLMRTHLKIPFRLR